MSSYEHPSYHHPDQQSGAAVYDQQGRYLGQAYQTPPGQPGQQVYQAAGQQNAPAMGQYSYPGVPQAQQPSAVQSWFNYRNPSYLKGLAVGAGLALVLTNPAVQKALVSGAVKLWTAVQGGVEEIKEHVQDIKAELSTKD